MKLRRGFVSNSSTSSFICGVCNKTGVAGMGQGMLEIGFVQCENGHELCKRHVKADLDEILKDIDDYRDEIIDQGVEPYGEEFYEKMEDKFGVATCDGAEYLYSIPEKLCPVCNMDKFNDRDVIAILIKHFGKTKVENALRSEKEQWTSYEDFHEDSKLYRETISEIEQISG